MFLSWWTSTCIAADNHVWADGGGKNIYTCEEVWPQCLHDWIWYFSHGCRQLWRRLGMCDHRALWPPQLCVFLSCLGPKTWTITPLNFYCRSAAWQKPQSATTHTEEKMTTLETTVFSDVQEKWSISSFTRLQMVQWLSPALGVGDRRAESLSCSCQWLDQDLHLWHMGQHSVRLLLPSAGFPPRRSEQASEIKWAWFVLPTVRFFWDDVYFVILTLLHLYVLLI